MMSADRETALCVFIILDTHPLCDILANLSAFLLSPSLPRLLIISPFLCRLSRFSLSTHHPASRKPCPSPLRSSQAADNFSFFLDKENELEVVGGGEGAGGASTTSADLRHRDPQLPRPSAATASLRGSPGTAATASGRGVARERGGSPLAGTEEEGEKEEDEEEGRRRRRSRSAIAAEGVGNAASAAVGGVEKISGNHRGSSGSGAGRSFDDVSKPMPRREAEPEALVSGEGKRGEGGRGGGGSVGRGLSSILHQSKGPTLLGGGGEEFCFTGLAGKGEDTPNRDHPEGWG